MKIALVRLSALGDIIQSSIVLQFIKKAQPKAKIDWFVDARFAEILKNQPLINEIYALSLKDRKISQSLKIVLKARKNDYDLVIDLQGLLKSAVIARILSKNAYGFDKKSLKESAAAAFYKHKLNLNYNENIILRNIFLINFALNLNFAEAEILAKKPCFKVDLKTKNALLKKLKFGEKNILIHVGSSCENKNYPKERVSLLCARLLNAFKKAKIWLCFGNEKEEKFAKFVAKDIKNERLNLTPKLNLSQLIAFSEICDLVIGNDSGPTHLAFAMNKPSITIFGATPSARNAYTTTINKIIDAGKKINDAKHIDKDDFCIQNIDEGEIFKIAKRLLK